MLILYFHDHTKNTRTGTIEVHMVKVDAGMITLSTHLRGTPQDIIETIETIWGTNYIDRTWEMKKGEAA